MLPYVAHYKYLTCVLKAPQIGVKIQNCTMDMLCLQVASIAVCQRAAFVIGKLLISKLFSRSHMHSNTYIIYVRMYIHICTCTYVYLFLIEILQVGFQGLDLVLELCGLTLVLSF